MRVAFTAKAARPSPPIDRATCPALMEKECDFKHGIIICKTTTGIRYQVDRSAVFDLVSDKWHWWDTNEKKSKPRSGIRSSARAQQPI